VWLTRPAYRLVVWREPDQGSRFSAEGKFIRKYVPELVKVKGKFVDAPWLLGSIEQQAAGCIIGTDYPAPIVEHYWARKLTLERYGMAKKSSVGTGAMAGNPCLARLSSRSAIRMCRLWQLSAPTDSCAIRTAYPGAFYRARLPVSGTLVHSSVMIFLRPSVRVAVLLMRKPSVDRLKCNLSSSSFCAAARTEASPAGPYARCAARAPRIKSSMPQDSTMCARSMMSRLITAVSRHRSALARIFRRNMKPGQEREHAGGRKPRPTFLVSVT